MKDMDVEYKSYSRSTAEYKNLSNCFLLPEKNYSRQFAYIYAMRLKKMRDILMEKVSLKWGSSCQVIKLSDLNETVTDECVIIGTFYKHQELKPSVLKENSEELLLLPQLEHSHYVSDSDTIILEDEQQRISLIGKIDKHYQATGVVVALKGLLIGNSKFQISDICYATPIFNPRLTLTCNETKYVLLMSGINAVALSKPILPELYLLIQLLTGWFGDDEYLQNCAKIARLVIAGNTIRSVRKEKSLQLFKIEDSNVSQLDLDAMDLADNIITDLVCKMEVDIMPGEFDPTNVTFPQQPLHPCCLPQASKYSTFHPVTNPYSFEINGKLILGTSGQPINDISKISNMMNPLDILEYTLNCGHLAPTAPDTLPCYPFFDTDPMIIENCPDVYFAGNQNKFDTKTIKINGDREVRLISVPDFYTTKSVAVLNLSTLECHSLTVGAFN